MNDLPSELPGPLDLPPFDPGFQTDWLTVRNAARQIPEGAEALERLCRTYWFPLYAYVRRKGHPPHDAQDLTQEFFAQLLARPFLQGVDQAKGRFRSFLLASMNNFLANEWRRQRTQKRGGNARIVSVDAISAEDRYRLEPSHDQSPDKVFDRNWAMTLIERVRTRLREECAAAGKELFFAELEGMLDGEKSRLGYAEIATRLGTTEGAVKKSAQRLRERFQELLRAEIAQTVSDPRDVEEELRCLFAATGS